MFDWLRKDKWTDAKEKELQRIRQENEVLTGELRLETRRRRIADINLQLIIDGRDKGLDDYV